MFRFRELMFGCFGRPPSADSVPEEDGEDGVVRSMFLGHGKRPLNAQEVEAKCELIRQVQNNALELAQCRYKGKLVRAARDIRQREQICLYEGDYITWDEYKKLCGSADKLRLSKVYAFQRGASKEDRICIDVGPENQCPGQYFNHVCKHKANIEPQYYYDQNTDRNVVFFVAKRDIKRGEELRWTYQGFKKVNNGFFEQWANCHCKKPKNEHILRRYPGERSKFDIEFRECFVECECPQNGTTDATKAR